MEYVDKTLVNLDEFNLSNEELFSRVDNSLATSEKITAPRYSYWKSVARVFFKKKINVILLSALAILVVFAFGYSLIAGFDRFENVNVSDAKILSTGEAFAKFGPGLKYLFGTGNQGQSIFNELWESTRISLSISFICAVINMTIGIVLGAVWGYSKKMDMIMTEVYNVLGNIPYVLLVSVVVLVVGAGFWPFVFALTVTGWLGIAYFIRTQVIIIRDREYNLASRCLGTPIMRITMKNILPFMTSIIVTLAATEIPSYISYEVFLSYIGFGLDEASLGKMIEVGQQYMSTAGKEFLFWIPVVVAGFTTVVLYVIGQNLGDASDPRTHM
ncbi:MAG: ABC transporter permease [Acholeplasmatales bacterium]|nr:ABC transporter permease [Acholeplasmatales bacterium]